MDLLDSPSAGKQNIYQQTYFCTFNTKLLTDWLTDLLDKDSKVDLAHHLSSLKNTVGAICDRVEKSMDVKKNISKLQKKLEKLWILN